MFAIPLLVAVSPAKKKHFFVVTKSYKKICNFRAHATKIIWNAQRLMANPSRGLNRKQKTMLTFAKKQANKSMTSAFLLSRSTKKTLKMLLPPFFFFRPPHHAFLATSYCNKSVNDSKRLSTTTVRIKNYPARN